MGSYRIDHAAVAALPAHPPIDAMVRSVADDVFDESQALVPQPGQGDDPYATGALKESGFVDGGHSEYRVGYGTSHAQYVEFGTSRMRAEPFLTPAALRYRGKR